MSAEDIDGLPVSVEENTSGHIEDSNKIFRGLKWLKAQIALKYVKPANGIPGSDIADNAISDSKVGAGTLSPNKISGTAVIATDSRLTNQRVPTDNSVSLAKLTATGTKDSTTYLRGDNTWSIISNDSNFSRFESRGQRNVPQNQITYSDKVDTAAGVVPAFDTPLNVNPIAINNGATGAALRVSEGFLTFAPTAAGLAAGYLTGVVDQSITVMGTRWKWDKTSRTTNGASICLAITASQMTAFAAPFTDVGVHLVVTPTSWQLDYITGGSGSTITNITSGSFSFRLAQDNFTEHEVQLFRNGNTIRILLPDGSIVGPITNANIGSKSGNAFWVEPFATAGNTDSITKIRDIWVGTGEAIAPTQQNINRKTFDQLAAWEPVIKGMYPTARAVGQASMPLYITTNRTIGAVAYLLGTADATGSMTVELRANGTTIAGTSATIAAGQVQGVAAGTFTFITGQKITIHVTSVGGTPGIGIDAQMLLL